MGDIFTKVLIPNSCFSLIEMFSYFFLNSMITISAVVRRIQSREKEEGIELNRYQFEMLTFLEKTENKDIQIACLQMD